MKQILQSLRSGLTVIESVPCPAVNSGQVLISSTRTLVSAGTERMLVDFGRASLLGKIKQQPDKLKMVLAKVRTDGLIPTIEAVYERLDRPLPMGYCNVGRVMEVGAGAHEFSIGDRVASNGRHAELVVVPKNLCVKVPDEVTDDEAAFTVLGAIGLQGVRLASPTLGECVVVTGLGLIGLITVQLLRAHGCRVLGLDYDSKRLALAASFGATVVDLSRCNDPYDDADRFSRGRGVDAVIITAATDSNEPVRQAARMCRKRGRIILVGVAGLELSRADFYEKELSFQVSCSYGPGRYDVAYEEQGFDYPVGFVRWTEQRNFEAVLDMMAAGHIDIAPLISHRFAIDAAPDAYSIVAGSEPSLGILLEYDSDAVQPSRTVEFDAKLGQSAAERINGGVVTAGFVGAGNYAGAMLIPAFKKAGAILRSVASIGGISSVHAAKRFGFSSATTDPSAILGDPTINIVVISTRHNSHAPLVCEALEAGKHVYVEKPLALTLSDVKRIEMSYLAMRAAGTPVTLMVGFNRRFAPHVRKIKAQLEFIRAPASIVCTINAGMISRDHWIQDPLVGGGRIVGECCHFIDLLRYLVGTEIASFSVQKMESEATDTAVISIAFNDGSLGVINYFANGNRSFPKERIEVFAQGRIAQIDNFRSLKVFGWHGLKAGNLWRQDKGQLAMAQAFVHAVSNGQESPIPFAELIEVAEYSVAIGEAIKS